jgi:hypothetical protein
MIGVFQLQMIKTKIQYNKLQDIDMLTRSFLENASGQQFESLEIQDVNSFLNELANLYSTDEELHVS